MVLSQTLQNNRYSEIKFEKPDDLDNFENRTITLKKILKKITNWNCYQVNPHHSLHRQYFITMVKFLSQLYKYYFINLSTS